MTNWRVLVVEDDIDGQEVVSRILKFNHINTDIVSSAHEALQHLTQNSYDLAILDLKLPDMSGWTLLDALKAQTPNLRCVAVTAYHSSEVRTKAFEAGFVGYFSKPIEASLFVRELEHILKGS